MIILFYLINLSFCLKIQYNKECLLFQFCNPTIMYKKLFFLIFSLLFFRAGIFSQNSELKDFTYLRSAGEIPTVFTSMFSEKYDQDKTVINSNDSRSLRKTKLRFLAQSNFIIDQILLSGRILFNDPVSDYINKVADTLLADNPVLRSQLSFYVSKSPSVNAFSTDKGIIIVNLGLIAQLENEAQLAYVLAHEIVHFAKKHNMNLFLEKDKIFKGKEGYNGLKLSEKYLATNYRSREIETEADEGALYDYYLKSPYSLSAIDGVFDVLQYSYLPFDDIVFDKNFFETSFLKFPENYFLTETAPIKGGEDYLEEMSTHPSIKSRREKIQNEIIEMKNVGKHDFIFTKAEFERIRALARFESIRQYVLLADYVNAIYNSYVLLKEYPENKFLERTIAYSLYAISAYKISRNYTDQIKGYKKIEGQSQQLYYFLGRMKSDEITALALRNCWLYKTKHPEDKSFVNICDSLFSFLVNNADKSIRDYSSRTKDEIRMDIITAKTSPDTVKKTGKYAKIKSQKVVKEIGDEGFSRFTFVDLVKDSLFKSRFEYFTEQRKEKEINKISRYEKNRYKKDAKLNRKYGYALGIDKVIVIDPFYYVYDERRKDNIKYFDSEGKLQAFYRKLELNTKLVNLQTEFINPKDFKNTDVDRFNDMMIINDWLTEKAENSEINLLPFETENIRYLVDKFGTANICFTGIISVHEKKFGTAVAVFVMLLPCITPYSVYYILKPTYQTYFFNIVFDIEKGKVQMADVRSIRMNDSKDVINSIIYDSFHQIKNKR